LRGEEIKAEKPANTFRILGIGDSFTFGYGIKDEDTFLHGLQLRLNARPPGKRHYETLNAGVGGYNTRDEILYLEHRWLALDPDLYKLKGGYPFLGIHALVKESCQRLGIPFLDLLNTFQGHDPAALWVHPSDHHPNETAHAMAAEAVERFVGEEFLDSGN